LGRTPETEQGEGLTDHRERYYAGARAALPFALVTGIVGVSFGVLAGSLGWGALAAIGSSVLICSASAQFAVAAVLGSGGGPLAAIVAAILLNARFGPMGLAIGPYLKGGPLRRALEGQTVLDTSWAMASRGGGRFDREFMIGASVPQIIAWVGGTALGAFGGDFLGNPERFGLDAIFPAFFIALLVAEIRRGRKPLVVALIAAALALVLIPVAPPGVPVISACVVALLGLRRSS
jgi:predicted branched-subunit amino acid permease